jgi:hypothetical protein
MYLAKKENPQNLKILFVKAEFGYVMQLRAVPNLKISSLCFKDERSSKWNLKIQFIPLRKHITSLLQISVF